MATIYSALQGKDPRAEISKALANYWDSQRAVKVLAELHQDLSVRGLICEDLFEDIACLQTSRELEQHLEGLIARHDLDFHPRIIRSGAVPFVLDDDLHPIYTEDFKATQLGAVVGAPVHTISHF
jgi:hypothetical protein